MKRALLVLAALLIAAWPLEGGGVFNPPAGGGGGGATIPSTTNVIKGDGAGNGADAGFASTAVVTLSGAQALTNKDLTGAGNTFPTLNQNTTGSSAKWTTARTLSLTGDVTWSQSVDGSGNVTGAATVANIPTTATFASDLTAVPNATGGWKEYFVTGSDASVTTSGADVTGLVSGTLSTTSLYEVEAFLKVTVSADTNGVKFSIHVGGTGSPDARGFVTGNTTNSNVSSGGIPGVDQQTNAFITASSGVGIVYYRAWVLTDTGTPTISIQAQKVTSGTATVKVGSILRIRKAHP